MSEVSDEEREELADIVILVCQALFCIGQKYSEKSHEHLVLKAAVGTIAIVVSKLDNKLHETIGNKLKLMGSDDMISDSFH